MQRWYDLSQVPTLERSVVTIGNFDGVHRGHRSVLGAMVDYARGEGLTSIAVTFDPHPAQVHRPAIAPALISGLTDRLDLLGETGLDAAFVVHYTEDFAAQEPDEFVRKYLVETLRAAVVVVGRDVRFGHGNRGDLATMVELGEKYGFAVQVIDDVHGGPGERRWSSTWVRELLTAGDVVAAADVLGRLHRIRGIVVHGDARGRTLGYPTANLGDSQGMVPADGVYAGWLRRTRDASGRAVEEQRLPAAISIGTNPTFDGLSRRVEAYVLDRTDLDLYDDEIVLEFTEMLRPTVRFDSIESLISQMRTDVDRTRVALGLGSE